MTEFKIFKFRESGTTSTMLEASEEMQVTSYINERSSFKPGKLICYRALLERQPEAYVLGLVYQDKDGKLDIEVGVGGSATTKEMIGGPFGFENSLSRELAEETQFSLNGPFFQIKGLRVGKTQKGISYLVPASRLQQIKTVIEPSDSEDDSDKRIDSYIYGSEEEIEALARNGRTLENGIVGYTVLKLSDLKPTGGYSPKARKAVKQVAEEGVELKEITHGTIGPAVATEEWIENLWTGFEKKDGKLHPLPDLNNDKNFLEDFWKIPSPIKMVEFTDENDTVKNVLLKKFLKYDPVKVKSVLRYYEA